MPGLPGDPKDDPVRLSYEEIEHELKTPLTSIRSLSEILRDHPELSKEQRQRFLDGVLHESDRLDRTVERLLRSLLLRERSRIPTQGTIVVNR